MLFPDLIHRHAFFIRLLFIYSEALNPVIFLSWYAVTTGSYLMKGNKLHQGFVLLVLSEKPFFNSIGSDDFKFAQ